jgi:hypothetical protein
MTAGFAKSFRRSASASGPHPATVQDVVGLNAVFSSAFTDRYRKDGLIGVHVPNLSTAIWRFAIEDANGGAMLWRGERDEIVAFNMCHLSGTEGWSGAEHRSSGSKRCRVRWTTSASTRRWATSRGI